MARNHVADTAAVRALRWCPTHQQALTHTTSAGWHWRTFPEDRLRYALQWMQAGQCTVRIVVVPCRDCLAETSGVSTPAPPPGEEGSL